MMGYKTGFYGIYIGNYPKLSLSPLLIWSTVIMLFDLYVLIAYLCPIFSLT